MPRRSFLARLAAFVGLAPLATAHAETPNGPSHPDWLARGDVLLKIEPLATGRAVTIDVNGETFGHIYGDLDGRPVAVVVRSEDGRAVETLGVEEYRAKVAKG